MSSLTVGEERAHLRVTVRFSGVKVSGSCCGKVSDSCGSITTEPPKYVKVSDSCDSIAMTVDNRMKEQQLSVLNTS